MSLTRPRIYTLEVRNRCVSCSSFLSDFLYRSICRFIAAIMPIYISGRDLTTWLVSGVLSNERSHCLTVTPRGTLFRGVLTNERLFVSLFVLFYLRVHSRIFYIGEVTVRHFEYRV